jgi:hypothetical protein
MILVRQPADVPLKSVNYSDPQFRQEALSYNENFSEEKIDVFYLFCFIFML